MRDRRLLYAAAFLRALATGMVGVLVGLYLARRGFDPAQIGTVVGVGLAGAALAALFVTLAGDRVRPRQTLVAVSLLATIGAVAMAATADLMAITAAAFVGMVNGMGRDRGAALIIDQSLLTTTVDDRGRTGAFAWYNVLQDAGHALGALAVGASVFLQGAGLDEVAALRVLLLAYAGIQLAVTGVYLALTPTQAGAAALPRVRISPESRRVLWKLSALFGFDSLAGGFLTAALLAYFFHERFGVTEAAMGALFFGARVMNALSHLGAAWLARRIGLVNTMVFTHSPSSLLLVTVAFAPSFPVAAVLFLLREGLVEMDVPTRQSYVMAIVRPEERTFAAGITQLVRLGAWAVAPAFAGLLMRGTSLAVPLVVGACMKVVYDFTLWMAFRRLRPPEER